MQVFQGDIKINECTFKKEICPNINDCLLKKKLDEIEYEVLKKLEKITIYSLMKKNGYNDEKVR
jgi:DNA-binding IscR family transcriptional regulator